MMVALFIGTVIIPLANANESSDSEELEEEPLGEKIPFSIAFVNGRAHRPSRSNFHLIEGTIRIRKSVFGWETIEAECTFSCFFKTWINKEKVGGRAFQIRGVCFFGTVDV